MACIVGLPGARRAGTAIIGDLAATGLDTKGSLAVAGGPQVRTVGESTGELEVTVRTEEDKERTCPEAHRPMPNGVEAPEVPTLR